jgi:hypothetical protein
MATPSRTHRLGQMPCKRAALERIASQSGKFALGIKLPKVVALRVRVRNTGLAHTQYLSKISGSRKAACRSSAQSRRLPSMAVSVYCSRGR